MSAVGRPRRVPRGRVVVVGERDGIGTSPQTSLHGAEGARSLIYADNLFEALGEVTIATAAEPVAAVLVPMDVLRRSSANPVEAFRRIDPSVRLILLVESEDELRRSDAAADGFDEVLVNPLGPGELEQAVEGTQPAPEPEAPIPAEPDQAPIPPVRTAVSSIADRAEVTGDRSETAFTAEDVAQAALTPPAQPFVPHEAEADRRVEPIGMAQEQLGDTDLVEAILTDPGGMRARALQLMSQQTHWSDLALSEDRPQRDSDSPAACVEVSFGRRSYGTLCSSQATAEQLRPWAEWLARWLALDRGYRDFRTMAFHDELTGAWNRRFYGVFMQQALRKAARKRQAVTVMVFDLDDFKQYNDQFGHEAGDEVLYETVRLLNSVIRKGDRVCRIGGDEFVVIFADPEGPREAGSSPPETVEQIAKRFQDQICQMKFPKLGLDAPGTLSISGGLATYPWDGTDPQSLLGHADQLALQSKKMGKNVITFGPGGQGTCR